MCLGLVFSPEGSELAGFFRSPGGGFRIIAWDVATGKVRVDHDLASVHRLPPSRTSMLRRKPLDWLTDKRGWLVLGEIPLEYRTGTQLGPALPTPTRGGVPPRRLVGTEHIATVDGPPSARTLTIEPYAP
jgi:hypothetical protein